MKIAAKNVWDVVRYLEQQSGQGKNGFLWIDHKIFYKPDDFICFKTSFLGADHKVNGLTGVVMPVRMILQSLYRQLLLNSYYPCCIDLNILFLYYQYLK